jgi:hypothetical protein
MKTKQTKFYKDIIEVLEELQKLYPSYRMGQHLSTALDEYGDTWGLTDKEIHFALLKYKVQMELDVPRETNEKELEKIIKDGMNLSLTSIKDNEEELDG